MYIHMALGSAVFEPRHEKTNNVVSVVVVCWTQTGLYHHRRWLEAGNFGLRKWMNFTICVAETKACPTQRAYFCNNLTSVNYLPDITIAFPPFSFSPGFS